MPDARQRRRSVAPRVRGPAAGRVGRPRIHLVLDHFPADVQPVFQKPIVDGQHAPVLDQHGRVVGVRVPSRAVDDPGPRARRYRVVPPRAQIRQRRHHFAQNLYNARYHQNKSMEKKKKQTNNNIITKRLSKIIQLVNISILFPIRTRLKKLYF